MSSNGKKALHVATFSGWYRFEQDGKEFKQTKRDLSYWSLTCMSVDPGTRRRSTPAASIRVCSIRRTAARVGSAANPTRLR